jgi:anthranilate synthase component 1
MNSKAIDRRTIRESYVRDVPEQSIAAVGDMSRSTFERFAQLAQSSARCVVPVWSEMLFDSDTPVSAFAKIRRGPFGFLLESAPAGSDTWARYSFLGTEPRRAWRYSAGVVEDWTETDGWHSARTPADPLADLDSELTRAEFAAVPELGEFWNGAVGYLGYDIVRLIENLPGRPDQSGTPPDAMFVFTRSMVIVDNLRSRARIVIAVETAQDMSSERLHELYDGAVGEIGEIVGRLESPSPLHQLSLDPAVTPASGSSSLTRDQFVSGVERIKEYIHAGDCFQALLSRRIETAHDFDSSSLYRALRALNPSPYMFHLVMDGVELVGSSPELLVRLQDDRVTVRPIAGTRPRSARNT